MTANNLLSTPSTSASQQTADNREQKKDLTDAQLCGYIIYWFHHFPNKAYLTTDEIFNQVTKFSTVTRKKVEDVLMGMAEGNGISVGGFENKIKNIPFEKRWHWSLKMSEENGKIPMHIVHLEHFQLENSNETSA